ncbi:MAG TPA: amidase family protein [Alphaproteobacteria bacterium]|jgi:Asp-tRNA(Asn)/Glu-tRNA(Gln) amidotransferase A subunit family amidase
MRNWRNTAMAGLLAGAALAGLTGCQTPQQQDQAASFQVLETSIDDIQAAYKAGTLTAHQLVQKYLDRIQAYDKQGPEINAIITLNEHALEDADKLDAAYRQSGFVGPLHGIPVLVKDEIDVAGMPTTMGTVMFKDYRPPQDAFVVDRVRKAGAIILGKTTMSEYARGDTYGSMFGVSRNPYDLERTVGGSSGGSAASVNANFSTIALGEETTASIRRPGAWNSIVSMRPTPGLVSRSGMWDGYPTTAAQMGPLARNVTDLARLLDVMIAYDPEDPLTAVGVGKTDGGSYTRFLDKNGLKGARIGILRDTIGERSEPGSDDFKRVDAVFDKDIAELRAAGATVVDPIVIPDLKALLKKQVADRSGSEEAMVRYLARNPNGQFKNHKDISNAPSLSQSMLPGTIEFWKRPFRPNDPAAYGAYLQAREELAINILKVMADNHLDAIVHKTEEHEPVFIKDGINPPYITNKGAPVLNTYLAYAASMTVPSGFTTENLPVGITFFGRPYSEPTLLKLAYGYEQATHHRIPPKTTPALAANVAGK